MNQSRQQVRFVPCLKLLIIRNLSERPNKTKTPMIMSHTMWTKSNACADRGPVPSLLPTSQNPTFATFAPLHLASRHPHQYVTPSTPHTGSVVKHFTGHEAGFASPVQMSAARSDLTAEMLRSSVVIVIMGIRKVDDDLKNGANITMVMMELLNRLKTSICMFGKKENERKYKLDREKFFC